MEQTDFDDLAFHYRLTIAVLRVGVRTLETCVFTLPPPLACFWVLSNLCCVTPHSFLGDLARFIAGG